MDESRLWGTLGIVLAIVGLLIISPEVLHAVFGGGEGGLGTLLLTGYGVAVVVAVLVTLAVIGPSLVGRPSR